MTNAPRTAPAWHNLATGVFNTSDSYRTNEMLQESGLANWNVRIENVIYPEGYIVDKPEHMVVRDFNGKPHVMGMVGGRYHTYQNEQLFQFADNILDSGGRWESAGSFKNGRVVVGSMLIGNEIVIDPQGANDKINPYLLVTTSHDGSSSIKAITTPVRVWCQNTLRMALKQATQSYTIRHTSTAEARVDEARKALGVSFKYLNEFELEARELFETSVTNATFDKIVDALYPTPTSEASKASITKHESKIELIRDLYTQPHNANIKGTAWGVFNALNERIDYGREARNVKGAVNLQENQMASASGFDTQANSEKERILSVVKELAFA